MIIKLDRWIKLIAYIGAVIWFVIFGVTAYQILLSGKQFIYNLSQMTEEDAYRIAYETGEKLLIGAGVNTASSITEEYIRNLFDSYMEQASELKAYEKLVFSQRKNVDTVGKIVAPITIIALVYVELKGAHDEDKRMVLLG